MNTNKSLFHVFMFFAAIWFCLLMFYLFMPPKETDIFLPVGQEKVILGNAKSAEVVGTVNYTITDLGLKVNSTKEGITNILYNKKYYKVLSLKNIKEADSFSDIEKKKGVYFVTRTNSKDSTKFVTAYNTNNYPVNIITEKRGYIAEAIDTNKSVTFVEDDADNLYQIKRSSNTPCTLKDYSVIRMGNEYAIANKTSKPIYVNSLGIVREKDAVEAFTTDEVKEYDKKGYLLKEYGTMKLDANETKMITADKLLYNVYR